MASVRFADVQSRPTEFLDFTSLTLDEFQQLVPPFETAFQAHMAAWRLDGKPRTARQFSVYKNCPLPTPEDRLFFILTYLKTYALQVVQGRLFGMCVFHAKAATDSIAILPLIPRQSCHRFHTKVATDSTAKLPPIPGESCH